jgi:hypothetical protein
VEKAANGEPGEAEQHFEVSNLFNVFKLVDNVACAQSSLVRVLEKL